MATTINAGRVRFVSRGTYNNSTQYYLFDLVDYNGSSYIAKENTLGNLPTNTQYWQLIAEKGDTYDDTEIKNDISSINTNIKANYYNKADTDTKLDTKANTSDVYNKTEIDTKINAKQDKLIAGTGIEIKDNKINNTQNSNVQVLQLNLVPNEEYIYSTDFTSWGIRMGELVYIAVEFGWKKVFENSDNTTVFISGFPTNLITTQHVYPTDTISGHKYRMTVRKGNLLNWWGNVKNINYGDSANRVQRLEILGYLQN